MSERVNLIVDGEEVKSSWSGRLSKMPDEIRDRPSSLQFSLESIPDEPSPEEVGLGDSIDSSSEYWGNLVDDKLEKSRELTKASDMVRELAGRGMTDEQIGDYFEDAAAELATKAQDIIDRKGLRPRGLS